MKKTRYQAERDREVLLVAYDYCVLGLRGEKLEKHRRLPKATLNRRIKQAKEAGYIREAVLNIPPEILETEVYPYVSDSPNLVKDLQGHFGRELLRSLIVIPSASEKERQKNPLINTERVGRAAAVRLLDLLTETKTKMEVVGISYGRTLKAMVDKVKENVEPTIEGAKKPKWIPIFGTFLLTTEFFMLESSRLAADLALAIRREASDLLNLTTPAYIPGGFMEGASGEEVERRMHYARKFVKAIPAHQLVFGVSEMVFGVSETPFERDPEALIARMDTMMTSVGGLSRDGRIGGWLGRIRDASPIYTDEEREQLEKEGVIGDFCGPFITEKNVDGFPHNSLIAQVNRRVLGAPTPKDFRRCADRARAENTPGVIVVADSATKARAVASVVSNRCVTELICDSDLAEELAKIKGISV